MLFVRVTLAKKAVLARLTVLLALLVTNTGTSYRRYNTEIPYRRPPTDTDTGVMGGTGMEHNAR